MATAKIPVYVGSAPDVCNSLSLAVDSVDYLLEQKRQFLWIGKYHRRQLLSAYRPVLGNSRCGDFTGNTPFYLTVASQLAPSYPHHRIIDNSDSTPLIPQIINILNDYGFSTTVTSS